MKKLSTYIVAAAIALCFASCGSDDEYTPGPQTPSNSIKAYFDADNTYSWTLSPEDEKSLTITLSRQNTDDAAEVPLHVEAVDTAAIVIPSTVSFAAGEATASIVVKCEGLTPKKSYGFTIAIDDAAADHYGIQDGATRYVGSVIVSTWVKLKDVKFYYYQTEGMPTTYSELYQLDGVNKFYLTDFLGSGTDLYFTVNGSSFALPDNDSADGAMPTGNGELVPDEGNVYTEDYTSYKLYTLYLGTNAAGDDVWGWTKDGVTYKAFYWYGGSSDYSYIDFDDNYIYMSAYPSSNSVSDYVSLYGVW